MATTTKVITTAEIIDLALNSSTGFDAAKLDDYILPAQREYLKPFLSKTYYDSILTMVAGATLDADSSALLNDYLKPMLAHYIVYDAFPEIQMNITSKGIMKNTSDTSEASSGSESAVLRSNKFTMAERWKNYAKTFIDEEQDSDSTKFSDFDKTDDKTSNKNGFIFY
jgi:hypothetical protein